MPVSNYTELYWKQDLHNLLHLIKLRRDSHAQKEIQAYAEAVHMLIKPLFPLTIEAWEDYVWYGHHMSRMEGELMQLILQTDMALQTYVVFTDLLEKKSVNYRTDASTEIHKVLGDVYVHTGDGKKTNRIALGSMMFIHNKYIKTETCHGFTSNVFWGIDNKVTVHYSMFTNWFSEGEYEADEMFEINPKIPPGRYNVIKKTVSFCNGKEHYTTNYKVEVEFFKDDLKTDSSFQK
jgi:hypothetical protein